MQVGRILLSYSELELESRVALRVQRNLGKQVPHTARKMPLVTQRQYIALQTGAEVLRSPSVHCVTTEGGDFTAMYCLRVHLSTAFRAPSALLAPRVWAAPSALPATPALAPCSSAVQVYPTNYTCTVSLLLTEGRRRR